MPGVHKNNQLVQSPILRNNQNLQRPSLRPSEPSISDNNPQVNQPKPNSNAFKGNQAAVKYQQEQHQQQQSIEQGDSEEMYQKAQEFDFMDELMPQDNQDKKVQPQIHAQHSDENVSDLMGTYDPDNQVQQKPQQQILNQNNHLEPNELQDSVSEDEDLYAQVIPANGNQIQPAPFNGIQNRQRLIYEMKEPPAFESVPVIIQQGNPDTDGVGLSDQSFANAIIHPAFSKLASSLESQNSVDLNFNKRVTNTIDQTYALFGKEENFRHTLDTASLGKLRDIVADGMMSPAGCTYNDLSPKLKKLADTIVAGLKQKHAKSRLSLELQTLQRNPMSETSSQRLEAVEQARRDKILAKIGRDSDRMKYETQYDPDEVGPTHAAEIGLESLNPNHLKTFAKAASDNSRVGAARTNYLRDQAFQMLDASANSEKEALLTTLATTPVEELRDKLFQQLHGDDFEVKSATEVKRLTEQANDMARALIHASGKLLPQVSGNELLASDNKGPTQIQFNGQSYKRVKVLGEGSFGRASLFRAANGEEVVVKLFLQNPNRTPEKRYAAMQTEIRMHRQAMGANGQGHENVLGLKGVISIPPSNMPTGDLLVISEPAKGGSLTSLTKGIHQRFRDGQISKQVRDLMMRQLFAQVVEGMHYLQQNQAMMHLDLKPDNIFIDSDGKVQIADFGLSHMGHSKLDGAGGTKRYMAPEVASGYASEKDDYAKNTIDYHADTWSLGVIGREMLTGSTHIEDEAIITGYAQQDLPNAKHDRSIKFAQNSNNRIFRAEDNLQHRNPSEMELESGKTVSLQSLSGFHQLINAMQHPDPSQRPTLEAVKDHHFINDPMLNSPKLKQLTALSLVDTSGMNPNQLNSHNKQIAELHAAVEDELKAS